MTSVPKDHPATRPIPGMDAAQAEQLRALTGLLDPSGTQSYRAFFCSPAGLALAQWAATFPARAKNAARYDSFYLGADWLETLHQRMAFELAQIG